MIKIIPAVAGLVSASALTHLFFNNNLRDFLMGTTGDNARNYTLRELLGVYPNLGQGSYTGGMGANVQLNMRENWMQAAGTLIAAKAIPKIIQKVGVTREANKFSKAIGLGTIVQL